MWIIEFLCVPTRNVQKRVLAKALSVHAVGANQKCATRFVVGYEQRMKLHSDFFTSMHTKRVF